MGCPVGKGGLPFYLPVGREWKDLLVEGRSGNRGRGRKRDGLPVRGAMMKSLLILLLLGGDDTGLRKRSIHPLHCRVVSEFRPGSDPVYSVQYSSDGRRLLTSGDGASIGIWSAVTLQRIGKLELQSGRIQHAVFSGDGKKVISVSTLDRSASVHEVGESRAQRRFRNVVAYFQTASLDPKGEIAALSLVNRYCVLVDVETGEERARLKGHRRNVSAIAFSRDGKRLATGGGKTVRIWDVETGAQIRLLEGHSKNVYALAFGPHGKILVSGSLDGTARIWNLPSGTPRAVLSPHTRYVSSVAVSPDRRWVVTTAWDGDLRFWNCRTGQRVRRVDAHRGTAWSSSFHPDGRRLATAGRDGRVLIWGMGAGEKKER